MGPYRTDGNARGEREARAPERIWFPGSRIRLGVHRFEISFGRSRWSSRFYLVAALCCVMCPPLLLLLAWALAERQTLVVTRNGAWSEESLFGIPWKRVSLGAHPKVEWGGWDWEEICVVPSEPDLRDRLEGGREVCVEWDSPPSPQAQPTQPSVDSKEAEARMLMAFMQDQINRLCGDR